MKPLESKKNSQKIKFIAIYGLFAALAIVVSYIERLIPMPIPLPGIKIGLANIVVLMGLMLFGARTAFSLSIIRIVAVGFLFGSVFSIIYSLAGGLFALLFMIFGKRAKIFGIVGISVLGGVFHNIGQIIVAIIILQTPSLMFYLPVLIIAGCVTGFLIGLVAGHSVLRLRTTPSLKGPRTF